MVKTISYEEFYKTEDFWWEASTAEQWLENGLELVFNLHSDNDGKYYLQAESSDNNDWFFDENPDYDRQPLVNLEKFCDDFAVKVCDTLDEVNRLVARELPKYCKFEVVESAFGEHIVGN